MKIYRFHPCGDRHTSWASLAGCCWPHATVEGDGPYAAASCGVRDAVLYPDADQAHARKRSLDHDGCRPSCYGRHHVIDLAPAHGNAKPPKPGSAVARRATTPAAPPAPRPERAICGRPRTNGEPCHRPPGWGADPGEQHCRDHGGSVTERLAAEERLAEEALVFARLVEKARTTPLTTEEQRQAEVAARAVLVARRGGRGSSSVALPVLAGLLRPPVVEVPVLVGRLLRLLDPTSADGGV